jgi:hypothetical protein
VAVLVAVLEVHQAVLLVEVVLEVVLAVVVLVEAEPLADGKLNQGNQFLFKFFNSIQLSKR